jgi:hypothetical protein
LYGLLLQPTDRSVSSPPVIIGVPPDSIRNANALRAALRWSAATPPWSQEMLSSLPPHAELGKEVAVRVAHPPASGAGVIGSLPVRRAVSPGLLDRLGQRERGGGNRKVRACGILGGDNRREAQKDDESKPAAHEHFPCRWRNRRRRCGGVRHAPGMETSPYTCEEFPRFQPATNRH